MRSAVCVVVRNEGKHIAEWLAWHHLAGFDAAIVFDHESVDDTSSVVRRMARRQDIRLHRWTLSGGDHRDAFQTIAYTRACQLYYGEFDWILFLDADEYFVLHEGSLADFLGRFPSVEQISLPWAIYGSSGHDHAPSGLIVEDYTMRALPSYLPNRHVKTIVRPHTVQGWPNPHAPFTPGAARDALGRLLTWEICPGISAFDPDYSVCQINHYMTRSRDHWRARMARASATSPTRSWEEFDAYDRNEVEDRCAADRAGALRTYLLGSTNVTAQGLIMDLGVSEGNDTAFYLSKGFKVIAVEADAEMCHQLRARFSREIASGDLKLLNLAASDTFGDPITIYVHRYHQGISGIAKRGELTDDYTERSVMTVDWKTLAAQAGVPRYLKIDISGNEAAFLQGMLAHKNAPEFISVECSQFKPVEMLFELGYRRFRLIDQKPEGGFRLPERQIEGLEVANADFLHASGPFGLDVFGNGNWLDFDALRQAWSDTQPEWSRTWFDCHAWKPN